MRCYACGAESVAETTEMVEFDGVAKVEASVRRCNACGDETVGYEKMETLVRSIARELARRERRLRPHELRWIRKSTGASGRDWARFINRDHATLSRYEHGKEPYPPELENLLRFAVLRGPQEWEYMKSLRDAEEPSQEIELKKNRRGEWVSL